MYFFILIHVPVCMEKIVILQETTEGMQQQDELTKKDALYNHLHESEKAVRSDTYMYDHPVCDTAQQDGYGMVSIDGKIDDNYCEVSPVLST